MPGSLPRLRRWIATVMGATTAFIITMPLSADASAQPSRLAVAGPWEAYRTVSSLGDPMCGISQFNNNLGLLIKHAQNDESIFLEVLNRNWRIPEGVTARVSFVVDGRTVLSARMRRASRHQDMLVHEFDTLSDGLAFVRRFADGLHMRVVFHDGTEGFWTVPLSGTRRVTDAFLNCMLRLYPRGDSQPFDTNAPQRSAPPAPGSQPHDPLSVGPGPLKGPAQ